MAPTLNALPCRVQIALKLAAGQPYRIIETRDWSLTDRTLFEGLRLAPSAQYTGMLAFACGPLDNSARIFTLTVAPLLIDNYPLEAKVLASSMVGPMLTGLLVTALIVNFGWRGQFYALGILALILPLMRISSISRADLIVITTCSRSACRRPAASR